MTDHYSAAERLLGESDRHLPEDPQAAAYFAAAQVHATLAVADQLARATDTQREPSPEIAAMVDDWLTRPNCTACGGTGKTDTQGTWGPGDPEPPAHVRVLHDPHRVADTYAWLWRDGDHWRWGDCTQTITGWRLPWRHALDGADGPLQDVTVRTDT